VNYFKKYFFKAYFLVAIGLFDRALFSIGLNVEILHFQSSPSILDQFWDSIPTKIHVFCHSKMNQYTRNPQSLAFRRLAVFQAETFLRNSPYLSEHRKNHSFYRVRNVQCI
jgi:hypothetical protein